MSLIELVCSKCKKKKGSSGFTPRKIARGFSYVCKSCKNEQNKIRWKQMSLEKRRKKAKTTSLKSLYGLTLEEYNQMFVKQKGCCAICGKHQSECLRSLSVDHSHKTSKIRKLLCNHCNRGLGLLGDSSDTLLKAYNYLKSLGD